MNLPLFPELAPPAGKPAGRRSRAPRREPAALSSVATGPLPLRRRHPVLWLCLRFPGLTLETLSTEAGESCLVVEGEGAAARLTAANERAMVAGVRAGMRLSAALALIRDPRLLRRDPARERACLAAAADAGLDFTDRVSLLPGEGLLLEIRGSLRLFGGLRPLRERILSRMRDLGHEVVNGIAPTPLAALWLARGTDNAVVETTGQLPARLGRLPLDCLGLDADTTRHLDGIGVRRLADLLRLPRAGLSRRWGPSLRGMLDRALGHHPDPRICWRADLAFACHKDLPMESDNTGLLLRVAEGMIARLVRCLRVHDSEADWLELRVHHHRSGTTRIRLGLPGVARETGAITSLLAIRMESVVLPEPARSLSLVSSSLRRHVGGSRGLFRESADGGREQELLARLRARLGEERVFAIASRPRHRPEAGWRRSAPGRATADYARGDRPLWLLPWPRPLTAGLAGLQRLAGPERIETGWWEGRDIARDYYRAVGEEGCEYWIFRDRRCRRWFVHGIFG